MDECDGPPDAEKSVFLLTKTDGFIVHSMADQTPTFKLVLGKLKHKHITLQHDEITKHLHIQ